MSVFPRRHHEAKPTFDEILAKGTSEYQAGRYNVAVKCLELSVSLKPTNKRFGAALHLLANAHLKIGDLDKAHQCFLGCVRLGIEQDWQQLVETELRKDEPKPKTLFKEDEM